MTNGKGAGDGSPPAAAPGDADVGAADTILQAEHASADAAYRAAGNLAGWQAGVAALAVGNDRLALFLAAAFAGPLLDVLGELSGGLHLVGGSRTGKSTAAVVAANLLRSSRLLTWRTGERLTRISSPCCWRKRLMKPQPSTEVTAPSVIPAHGNGRLHQWQPGQSGNPGGVSKATRQAIALAKEASPRAMAALIGIMDDPAEDARARIVAVAHVLDRALGKPKDQPPADDSGPRVNYDAATPEQMKALSAAVATIRAIQAVLPERG